MRIRKDPEICGCLCYKRLMQLDLQSQAWQRVGMLCGQKPELPQFMRIRLMNVSWLRDM